MGNRSTVFVKCRMPVSPDDPRIAKSGFALLKGQDMEYYVKKYELVLGRNSKSTNLDVVLGENMNISRQHATIRYNFDLKVFELHVLGKNGVTVNNELYTPASQPLALHSQDFLQVGDKSFYFLLPRDSGLNGIRGRQRNHSLSNYPEEEEEEEEEPNSLDNGMQEYEENEESDMES